jgi:hypothetical protein
VPVLFGGHNLPTLVEIWLPDLPKFGGAMAPGTPRDSRSASDRLLKKIKTDIQNPKFHMSKLLSYQGHKSEQNYLTSNEPTILADKVKKLPFHICWI